MKKSRKKRGIGKWAREIGPSPLPLERAIQDLERVDWILRHGPDRYQGEEWMLLATLVVEADKAIDEARAADPDVQVAPFDIVMDALSDAPRGFTGLDFLRSTRAVRRQGPALFAPGDKAGTR